MKGGVSLVEDMQAEILAVIKKDYARRDELDVGRTTL